MNLAVVLVSEQTIPNVVYLKNLHDFGEGFDKVLLVTTEKMERGENKKPKSEAILEAFDPEFLEEDKHYKLYVDEKMLFNVEKRLSDYFKYKKFDKIFVNITGGTKIMSLAAYKFFDEFNNEAVEMVYLPLSKSDSYKQIKPLGSDGKAIDVPIKARLSVDEYLKASGVEYETQNLHCIELSEHLYRVYFEKENVINQVTQILREYRSEKKRKKIKQSEDYSRAKELLRKIGVDIEKGLYDLRRKRWVDFFSGGWFEEYVYSRIQKMCIDDAKLNVEIKRKRKNDTKKGVENEFDVMFTKDNYLYIVECKSGDMNSSDTTNSLYKTAQLKKELGLSVESYFLSLSRKLLNKNIKGDIKARSEILGVDLIFRDEIETKGIDGVFEKFQCK